MGNPPRIVSERNCLSWKPCKLEGVIAYTSIGLIMGCRGTAFGFYVKLIMRGLWEGSKTRKESGQIQEEQAWENVALYVFMWLPVKAPVSVCLDLCDRSSVCTVQCVHAHVCIHTCLLGIHAQPHYWLDLGIQSCSSITSIRLGPEKSTCSLKPTGLGYLSQ